MSTLDATFLFAFWIIFTVVLVRSAINGMD